MYINNYYSTFKGLFDASRPLICSRHLITVFPFYAILVHYGFINSFWSLLLIIPFIPLFAAGFMYNTICDADKDPKEKNPITGGVISQKLALTSLVLLILLSIFIFILVYSSMTAFLLFLFLLFLWLAYSGIKIRFKERIIGPVIASVGFFVLPSAIILTEFNFFNLGIFSLILGIFFIYTSHEIQHTIIDYESDLSFKCRTYAVITGKKIASISEYIFLIIGFILLLFSLNYFIGNLYVLVIFAAFFSLTILSSILYGIHKNFQISKYDFNLINNFTIFFPYIATRLYLIILGCLILNLPILLVFFVVWILFTDKFL
ncbi:MAG: UbiA family prenyltransferase [Methanobacterium sp.]